MGGDLSFSRQGGCHATLGPAGGRLDLGGRSRADAVRQPENMINKS